MSAVRDGFARRYAEPFHDIAADFSYPWRQVTPPFRLFRSRQITPIRLRCVFICPDITLFRTMLTLFFAMSSFPVRMSESRARAPSAFIAGACHERRYCRYVPLFAGEERRKPNAARRASRQQLPLGASVVEQRQSIMMPLLPSMPDADEPYAMPLSFFSMRCHARVFDECAAGGAVLRHAPRR